MTIRINYRNLCYSVEAIFEYFLILTNGFELRRISLTSGRIINELWKDRDYTRESMIHLSGEYKIGEDGFMEFHADEAALKALVMRLFYQKVG